MEIVIALFVLVAGSIAFSAWKNSKSPGSSQATEQDDDRKNIPSIRTCTACGFKGDMKTWIANYVAPKIIVIVGFVLGYLPGVIFLVYYWGKYKCPNCGAIDKNTPSPQLPE